LKGNTALLVLLAFAGGAHAQVMDHSRMDHSAHKTTMSEAQRQADVARRGKDVMPFDLAATTHVFTKTAQGGVQQVVVKDINDVTQVSLTRQHLREIRDQFLKGDFSGPARIHGQEMPGLAELKAARPGEIDIAYADLKNGAELSYSTANAKLVAALHQWFDAQLADHGKDAMAGHAGQGKMKKP
jgi:hypothetical protein